MNNLLTNAGLYHDQAERMLALAMQEESRNRQRVMLAIAEQYFLLHDHFVELGQLHGAPALRLVR
jgi:hypothetical protein